MKILITGAKGQLGLKLKEILSPNFDLILTDSVEMDITDAAKVDQVVGREKPDFIIHGAAYTKVDQAEVDRDLCMKINAEGTKNVAKAASLYNSTLIYISTDFVFDGKKRTPYTEEDEAKPLSVYGKSKLAGEKHVASICEKYYTLRAAWLFGELPEGHPGSNFVETMLRLARERDELNVVSDQIGSPTYTGDLVEAINKIVSGWQLAVGSQGINSKPLTANSQLAFGLYHFSGTSECSWYDFAKEIFEQAGVKVDLKPIKSDQYPQKAKRPPYSYLDKSKIENALGIKVRSWQEMLRDYLNSRPKN